MKKLNLKLFLILLGATAGLAVAVFVAHRLQTGRIAGALLWQAERTEREGQLAQTAKYLSRYLEFVPDDLEQRARLARTLASDQLATSPRARQHAFFVLDQVLNRDPERHDLRKLTARLAMDLRRLDLAKTHLTTLQQALPHDGEVHHLFGKWHEANKDYPEARLAYEKAIQHDPTRVESYVRLTELLRGRLEEAARADEVMDRLVQANGRSFEAHLVRGRYQKERGLIDEAAHDIARARELAPDDVGVLLTSAEVAQAQDDFAQARAYLQRGFELYPRESRLFQALAHLEVKAGRGPEALACLRQGAKTLTGQPQIEVLWELANLLLDESQWNEAKSTVGQAEKAGASQAAVDYLHARLALGARDWSEAARLLERTRPVLESLPEEPRELLVLVDLYLGQCYERLHEPARQLAAFNRVLARAPSSVPARLGAASAQQALGHVDDALAQYRQLSKLPEAAAAGWLETARLLIRQNLQRGEDDRSWQEVQDALARAYQVQPNLVDVVLLQAQVLMEQKEFAKAGELLNQARERNPKQAEFWAALAELAERTGESAKVPPLLDEAQRQAGDTVTLRLARARYHANRRSPDAAAAVAQLVQGLEKFNADAQAQLLIGLAEASFYLGQTKEAARLWARLAEQPRYQNDLRLRLLLFDLALKDDDESAMEETLKQIRRIEGSQETMYRYGEALRLLRLAKRGDRSALDQARGLLDQVAVQRPTWPAVLLARAELENLKGSNPGQAIAYYRKAVELGERSPRVVRQLVQLLRQMQRYDEAEQEMRKLPRQMKASGDMQRLAADISLRNQDPVRAVELALEAVSAESKDYRDHLWLGQLLAASGRQHKEAEDALRKAVALADTVPETWVALVQFLAATNPKEAEAAIEQAKAKLPAEPAPLALALCYEAVGKPDLANQQFLALLAKKPNDVLVLRDAISFYLRAGRFQDAEPALRRVLAGQVQATKDDEGWARRSLALALAATPDGRRFNEALELLGLRLDSSGQVLETKQPADDEAVEWQRARAQVLATQKHRNLRAKAASLLEDLRRRQALTAGDQFLLAQLYDADGNASWPKARELMRQLLGSQPKNPSYLGFFADALLRRRETDEAQRCVDKLEALEKARDLRPGGYGTLVLKSRVLEARGDVDRAYTLLKTHVERKDARPEEVLLLISLLGRQKRLADALDLCDKAWQTCPPDLMGSACVAVLRAATPADEQCARVENWLTAALVKQPRSVGLLNSLADLYDLRGRYREAEDTYKKVLNLEPRNPLALNNLAWLMANRSGNGAEALELINRAIEQVGPRPELLDTRAMVHLAMKRSDLAIQDLTQATQETPTGPRYFHLASAHQLARQTDEALRAFRKAKDLGLKRHQLHPVEQLAWGKVFDELERR